MRSAIRRLLLRASVGEGASGPTFSTLFGLLAVTGMRVGEAVALNRTDVDLTAGRL
jgi:integrase